MEAASPEDRRERLKVVYAEASGCVRCPLAATRTTVVFGSGHADAGLMFVGEAPGAQEDKTGLPFVGQAGKLLDRLLGEVGLARHEVFIANVVKCRPPQNRDPHPNEIEACRDYLVRQVELIQPLVVCSLGNFATKLLRGDPTGITRVHGQPEVRSLGAAAFRLYPLFHPAAALYTPATLEILRADFQRIPALLKLEPAPPPPPPPTSREPALDEAATGPPPRAATGGASGPEATGGAAGPRPVAHAPRPDGAEVPTPAEASAPAEAFAPAEAPAPAEDPAPEAGAPEAPAEAQPSAGGPPSGEDDERPPQLDLF